jgi:hypothetical protein
MALDLLPNTEMKMSGHSVVEGDAGLMAPSRDDFDMSGDSQITGTLYIEAGARLDDKGKKDRIGAIKNADLSALEKELTDQIDSDTHLPSTQHFDDIKKSLVIQGNGKTNVVEVEGDIHLSGKDSIVLMGQAGDVFILNVEGKVHLSGSSSIQVSGGALASNVFIHVLGHDDKHASRCTEKPHGKDLHLSGSSSLDGNAFVVDGDAHLSGKSVIHGSLILSGKGHMSGQSQIAADPKCGGPAPTPAPDDKDKDDKDKDDNNQGQDNDDQGQNHDSNGQGKGESH